MAGDPGIVNVAQAPKCPSYSPPISQLPIDLQGFLIAFLPAIYLLQTFIDPTKIIESRRLSATVSDHSLDLQGLFIELPCLISKSQFIRNPAQASENPSFLQTSSGLLIDL